MSNLKLFIAGHVIGLHTPEIAPERAKINEQSEFFAEIGFDVVNPVELLDDTSDPKDKMCKYIRMMLDCTHVLLFPEYMLFKECQTASLIASVHDITPMVCEPDSYKHGHKAVHATMVRKIAMAIQDQTGVTFIEYANENNHEQPVQRAKAMFVEFCMDKEMPSDEIAFWLNIKCAPKSISQIIRRHHDKFNKYYKADYEFRIDVERIQADLKQILMNDHDRRKEIRH